MAVKRSGHDYLDELYDSFRIKNMGRLEFKQRYRAATSPKQARIDLEGMIRTRQLRGQIDVNRICQ